MANEKEGFPITAIREIKLLARLAGAEDTIKGNLLRHSIVRLREVVRSSGAFVIIICSVLTIVFYALPPSFQVYRTLYLLTLLSFSLQIQLCSSQVQQRQG